MQIYRVVPISKRQQRGEVNTITSFSNHVIIVVSQLTFPLFKSNGFVRGLCYIQVRGDLFANGVQNNLVFRRLHISKPTCCCVVLIV